jgi:predicted GNAT family N-acyltransferase
MALCIQALNPSHQLVQFDCGRDDLNLWLHTIARQHQKKRVSSTFVLIDEAQATQVIGYYALTICSIIGSTLPSTLSKKLPATVPAVKLGRLASNVTHRGDGLRIGETLLLDALTRSKHISDNAGGFALFVDAIDERVLPFYERYGFHPLPSQPLTLFIQVADL